MVGDGNKSGNSRDSKLGITQNLDENIHEFKKTYLELRNINQAMENQVWELKKLIEKYERNIQRGEQEKSTDQRLA